MGHDQPRGNGENGSAEADATSGITRLRRRDVLAAGGAFVGASVAGCLGTSGGSAETDTSTTTDTTMPSVIYRHNFRRISMMSGVRDGAEQKGLWRDQGVDVDFKSSTGAMKAAKAVSSGNADFGNGDFGTIMGMINNGAPLTIIGHIHYPLNGIVAKGNWLDRWKDLEGKVVAQYDPERPLEWEAIRRDGGDPTKVEWQTVNPGAATKLLVDEKVDAAAAYWPPNVIRLQNRGLEASALSTGDALNYMGLALYGNTNTVENKPEVTNGFVRGLLNAWKWGVNKPDEVVKFYRDQMDIKEEEFQKAYQYKWYGYYLASMLPDRETAMSEGFGWVDTDRLQETLNLYTELDMLDEAKPIDEYLNLSYFEENQDLAVESAEAMLNYLDQNHSFGTDKI